MRPGWHAKPHKVDAQSMVPTSELLRLPSLMTAARPKSVTRM